MKAYYDARAPEYDDVWLRRGLFDREKPGWDEERDALAQVLARLPPARTLDVACGTGFLTRHLPGEIVALDQSDAMLAIARRQAPRATCVLGDALALPFEDSSFDRLFTSFFYGHLERCERLRFLAEARRVAGELVVVDAAIRDGIAAPGWQERLLEDGSRWHVYKRYFTPTELLDEIGGGRVLHAGRWFVSVAA